MPSTLTVQKFLAEFLAEKETALTAAASPSTGAQLRQAFIDGMCAGITLAVRAFEMSKSPQELHAALEDLAAQIDCVSPEQFASPVLADAPTAGSA